MPDPISAVVAGISTIGSSVAGGKGAKKAASAEVQAAQLGIDEQRAAREELRTLLSPYTQQGPGALSGMLDLIGLNGRDAQSGAVSAQEASPFFQAFARQGEDAILQNASATGGLRGGNVQSALNQFRPNLLNQFIQQQYGRLSDIATLGQQSAAGVGAAGQNSANAISQLLQSQGSARAGGALAQGQAIANPLQLLAGFATGGFGGGFGGGVPQSGRVF